MNNRICEIELNMSNKCGAACYMCSTPHGNKNIPLMTQEVFDAIVDQLHDVDFDVIQTSGNGDGFLNPNWFDWVRRLRSTFPDAKIHFYSSFGPMTKERIDIIVKEDLLDEVYTRIDSLDPATIHKATKRLDGDQVLSNMRYFATAKRKCKFVIGYSSIPQYYRKCRKLLRKEPLLSPFEPWEVAEMRDEFGAIGGYFRKLELGGPTKIYRIRQSMWAERLDPRVPSQPLYPCPKMESKILEKIMWICPNGAIDVCGYDDTQGAMAVGNLLLDHILDIWNGEKRKEMLQSIASRSRVGYPCNNPACCVMWADGEI